MAYFLGCPMWANKAWLGTFFARGTRPAAFLAEYASVLNSVEGNTTFYALPKRETVAQWAAALPRTFSLCLKFPKTITHEAGLQHVEAEVARFFETIEPLSRHIGFLWVQLPPSFAALDVLGNFLNSLPRRYHLAVEVRNLRFFDQGANEAAFVDLLRHFDADRVIFDTHRLLTYPTDDPELCDAQRRKPKMPPRFEALGPRPVLRYVGRPRFEEDREVLRAWAERVATWIRAGRTPYVYMHQAPEDGEAPQLCRVFHELVREFMPELPALPPFPCARGNGEGEQLSLF